MDEHEVIEHPIARTEHGHFAPGVSPNPYGRARKGTSFAEIAASLPEGVKRAIIDAQVKRAKDGSVRHAEFVRDTAEGRPAQRVDVTNVDAIGPFVRAALDAYGGLPEWMSIDQAQDVVLEGEVRAVDVSSAGILPETSSTYSEQGNEELSDGEA